VLDMSAYARLLLARGDVPAHDGARMLSEEAFEEWVRQRVPDGAGGTYGYGWWQEDVDGARWIAHSGGMVGYTAFCCVSPDERLGLVILQNGDGGKRGLARTAFAQVRAALAGAELPEPWAPPAATTIPDAAAYVGTYSGEDGRVFEVRAEDGGLRLDAGGQVSTRLERDPLTDEVGDAFLVPHDALERFSLVFGRGGDGVVVEAFHGDTWFRSERYAGPEPGSPPEEWRRYVGFYRNNDPWAPTMRVVMRKGQLAIQWPNAATDDAGDEVLVPLDDGWFAGGSATDPRRVRFLGTGAGGMAVVAEYNGGSWFRSFER
jgi:beta-lactamase family protein